jgi:hypothetical protein
MTTLTWPIFKSLNAFHTELPDIVVPMTLIFKNINYRAIFTPEIVWDVAN